MMIRYKSNETKEHFEDFCIYNHYNVQFARVAQSAERSAVNRKVGGSNPPVSEFLFTF